MLTLILSALIAAPTQLPEMVKQTNTFRKEHKLTEVAVNETLCKVAQAHAEAMARQDKMAHELDGKGPGERIEAALKLKDVACGENVHCNWGHRDPLTMAVKSWIESPGHRENMLTAEWRFIGVGAAKSKSGKWYFCQVFTDQVE